MTLNTYNLLAVFLAMTTSIILIAIAVSQNAALRRENLYLRRSLRMEIKRQRNVYYDPDIAKEDLWTTK